jgi:ribose transport system permease protein
VGVYALGGLMAGCAALLLTGRMSGGHPTAAIGLEFDAIAAVIVGGTSFERGNGWLPGTLLGVLTVGVLRNGLNVLAVSSSLQVASIGLLVILALFIDGAGDAVMAGLGSRLLGVLLVATALTLASDAFFSVGNLLNVLRQASLIFLVASGVTLVVLTAGLDLSVGANVSLSACLAAAAIKAGSLELGIAAGLACGTTIGLLNGLMVTLLRIPPFIATYGMLWVVHGISYWYMAGQTIYDFESFRALGSLPRRPVPVLMGLFLAAGGVFARYDLRPQVCHRRNAGRRGCRHPVRIRLNLAPRGAMAGLASIVYLARLNSAEADIGEPLLLPAVGAILIGGTSLFGGIGSLSGTLVGAVLLSLVLNGMNLLAIGANWQPLVNGVIVISAVWIDVVTRRRSEAKG